MKIIFKIARAELRNLFYSPIAWLVLILFYIIGAVLLTAPVERMTSMQEVMLEEQENWIGFAGGISANYVLPLLQQFAKYIYMLVPLLTMGVINREVNTGTIKLLYSSPVSTSEIVLGKYLGIVFFNILVLLVFSIIMVASYFNIEHAETGWYMAGLLALFLILNAFSAIGLFVSALTSYQVVAAVLTFALLFVLSNINALWQQYDLIRDLTLALSMQGRAELMLGGLITSRDVIYFLLIVLLFVGFTLIKLKSTQESKKWTAIFTRYTGLFLLVCILGYFSSRPGYIAYADLTKTKRNTLHPATQAVLKELDGSPLTVTLYTNLLGRSGTYGLPQSRNNYIWGFWEPYIRFYPNIHFKYEYYYGLKESDSSYYRKYPGKTLEEIAVIQAEILGIRSSIFKKKQEIDQLTDLSKEDLGLLMELEYKGKKTFLRTYTPPDVWPTQENVSGSIKRLSRSSDVRIGFLSGHFERSPFKHARRDYQNHAISKSEPISLINNGVDCDTFSLQQSGIPANVNLLVIADPRSEYSQEEKNRINQYIDEGRNAIILSEPGKQFILQPILSKLGVHVNNGIIVHPNEHEMPHLSVNKLTRAGNFLAKERLMQYFQDYGIMGGQVWNEGAGHISFADTNGFTIEPVIVQQGNENTWIENGVLVVDSAAPVFSAAEGDVRKTEYVVAVKLTRKINNREQRIIVASDADFMTFERLSKYRLNLALYSWGLNNRYPAYANYPLAVDRFFTLSNRGAQIQLDVLVYLVPAGLILLAVIVLVRRKRK
ncbi:ABC transporter permease subunit [Pseudobacter ginsenosidimutans]|uniref:ABC-2 type transport system permease protein n=1 Tax=Pseudobacter ginsenosidimutans TaxID=661488 RepID=A0A4Q7N5C0_9BACT|nr:Gldg family protein [Pseudobacter ginsenosidimutans]RZS76190.1 ABC-2 type transport system permease protein [Pseudobacter ginsenosidimutans]